MNSIDKQLLGYLNDKNLVSYAEQEVESDRSYFLKSAKREYLVDYDFTSSEELENMILDSLSGKLKGDISLARLCAIEIYENSPLKSEENGPTSDECVIPDFVYAF